MRHGKSNKRLSRNRSLRKATLRDLARSVIKHQSIRTTKAKAKEARKLVERLITFGKRGDLSAKRLAYAELCDHSLVSLLFNDIAPRFKNRNGGYTRIINWVNRKGDNAHNVVLQLTEIKLEEKKVKKSKVKEEKIAKSGKEAVHTEKVVPPKKEEKKEKPKPETATATEKKERPKKEPKPPKKFMGGLKGFFKKERDSL